MKRTNENAFGTRLVEARLARGLSQSQLANQMNMTQQNLSNYERGVSEPRATVLAEYSDALLVSPAYLIGLTEDPTPYWNPSYATRQTTMDKEELLNLWDRVDETAKSLVIAGLKAVASDLCDATRDVKDGHSSV